MVTLRCDAVSVSFGGERIVHRVSADVAAGEWVTVIGPNGAGKSTLLRAISGLAPYDGRIELNGSELRALPRSERTRTIALVPQNPLVPPNITVADYVLLGRTPHLPLLGTERREDLLVVERVLDQLELTGFIRRRLETLSGGELQRTIIARALAQEAPVLLLDEPTTSLDVGHQQEVLELVDELHTTHSLTVVSTMHDLTIAGQYADRLVLLAEGEVVAAGQARDVLTEELVARHYGARVRVLNEDGEVIIVPNRHVGEPRP